ncbi:MAG: hypothetical protein KW788_01680 [Candidatus Doudnabacteria bacterium]|nr:hypothetical protein [Candidatus Doudnabacteria bacterium]
MYWFAEKLFYTLSAVVLGSAFFVIQPTQRAEVAAFQHEVRQQFAVASHQVFGDEPLMVDSTKLVVSSVYEFYMRSADAFIALTTPSASQNDLNIIIADVYNKITTSLDNRERQAAPQVLGIETVETQTIEVQPLILPNFMQEEPVMDIVPSHREVTAHPIIQASHPAVNDHGMPWVDLRDNQTGQIYCVAIYNAEVNRYLGPCIDEYH